jgi:hypothetical protein
MGDEVRAGLPAMERFAATSMDRRDEFDHLRERMESVRLPRDAFGYIPGIGNRVHDAYEEFVTGCADAISSAAESMASVAAAVRGTIVAYSDSDHAAAEGLDAVRSGLAGTDLRGLK